MGLGLYSVLHKELGQTAQFLSRKWSHQLIGFTVLFLIGILNGSLTSGIGLFVTLWLVRWFRFDYKQAVAYTLVFGWIILERDRCFSSGWLRWSTLRHNSRESMD